MIGIGDFIKDNRIKSGFGSQRKLAEKSGISAATISRIESGVQKPNPDTLKELSKYLTSTSFVELMVVGDYWDDDDLLEPIQYSGGSDSGTKLNETPYPYKTEKEFIGKLELSDEKLLKQFDLELDGQKLSEDEAKGVIAYLRSLRQIDK
ncbi:helix-turn-helix domain-containing protein [Pseudogracilibacillus auburnensis]|uniref:helix-turn-helix domain-containing protein n=1 Tax=Pseudogracilibacillus auburnensis TaxID=1494959 RepID=UPI001A96F409|nr:helix-turn-helix transcriptional regulator [Pseudogracilibacillus auburnensis]MBO1003159.1 helix-turn-helix transcriptional regulator [Pseudogracilibacillus auburnensis]